MWQVDKLSLLHCFFFFYLVIKYGRCKLYKLQDVIAYIQFVLYAWKKDGLSSQMSQDEGMTFFKALVPALHYIRASALLLPQHCQGRTIG